MTAIEDALNAIATLMAPIATTYVYPRQFSTINLTSLPKGIVSMRVGVENDMGVRVAGQEYHTWEAELMFILAEGALKYPNQASATAEALQFPYPKAVADILYANQGLSNTAQSIGKGKPLSLFTYMIDHVQWEQKVYWAVRFMIPITQRHTVTVNP